MFPTPIRDFNRLPSSERLDVFGELIRSWHRGTADQHWQHRNIPLQGGAYLDPVQVVSVSQFGLAAMICCGQPIWPDHDYHHARALKDGFHLPHEIPAGTKGTEISKYLELAQIPNNAVIQTARVTWGVSPPVADENGFSERLIAFANDGDHFTAPDALAVSHAHRVDSTVAVRANSQHGVLSDPNVDKRITDVHGEAATTPHSHYLSCGGRIGCEVRHRHVRRHVPSRFLGYAGRPGPDRHENGPDR